MENYSISLVVISYVMSVIGSLMALTVTRAALNRASDSRGGLLFLAALCLGGVGIWSMHFIGMLAFNMNEMIMNFNWGLTALSFVVGVGVVYIGLLVMGIGELKLFKLILAGVFVGCGVAGMHYTGMLAMEMQADVQWNWTIIAISIGIAVAAAIVALWLAINVKQMWQIIVSALVMGVAVCGMHYTGMAAANFAPNAALPFVEPMITSTSFFTATIATLDIVIVIIAMVVTMQEGNKRRFTTV
ncbi:MHYT domain-containing protein [Methyloglobulus sp.]|uniref:MHYT domain-containing protein n=1 Tax=Methyloglobulus sp. TaxID=2518622 RepID=UPI0032B7E68F